MKRKDIGLIAAVVVFSLIVGAVVSHLIFSKPQSRKQTAEVVQPIKPEFSPPDPKYFNEAAFDPTQLIEIGDSNNTDPFKPTVQ